jgi:DNA-binding NarL/FixJ family response regulator
MPARTLAVCEDHSIVVDGLRMALYDNQGFALTHHVRTGKELMDLLAKEEPDLLVLDLNLGKEDGFDLLAAVRKQRPRLPVLILTMYDDAHLIEKAQKAGANGYLLKSFTIDELMEALTHLRPDAFFLPESLQKRRVSNNSHRDQFVERMKLTKREIEIIRLVVEGKSAEVIASQLFLSEFTVRTHRKNILKKLNLNNTADLVRFAFENHLVG